MSAFAKTFGGSMGCLFAFVVLAAVSLGGSLLCCGGLAYLGEQAAAASSRREATPDGGTASDKLAAP